MTTQVSGNKPSSASGEAGDMPDVALDGEVTVVVSGHTDVGNERDVNEDNFLVADLTLRVRNPDEEVRTVGPKGIVFAVCDGMGGAAAGEVASDLAVETLYSSLIAATAGRTTITRDDLADALETGAMRASERIHKEASDDLSKAGMGTTFTAAALTDRHLVFAQVGDSRGYLLRNGRLTQITRDQSLVAKLVEQGKLAPEHADTYEHSNIILQALGATPSVIVEVTYVELGRGDRLLLCSDGLHGLVPYEEIQTFMTCGATPNQICIELIERAKELGGHDNVTAVVAFFEGIGLHADIGSVVVNARGGGTELFEIPDPKQLADLMGAGGGAMAGTAVLAAVAPNAISTPPPPPEPVPPLATTSDPVFPPLPDSPSLASLMSEALESEKAKAASIPPSAPPPSVPPSFPLPAVARSLIPATQTPPDDDGEFKPIESVPPPSKPTAATAVAATRAVVPPPSEARGGQSRAFLIAGVILLLACLGGVALYIVTATTSKASGGAAGGGSPVGSPPASGAVPVPSAVSTWTTFDSPSAPAPSDGLASTPQLRTPAAAAAKPADTKHAAEAKAAAAAAAAAANAPRPTPTAAAATASGKKSDLAPQKDDD